MATEESSGDQSAGVEPGQVFISHHSSQHEAARLVKAALEQVGIDGWLAPDDVDPGSAFDQQILQAIQNARAVVVLLCAQSDRSRHVKREVMLADDANKPVFPVRLEPVKAEGLAYWLKDYQWIDWFGGKRDGLDRLVQAVRDSFAPATGQRHSAATAGNAPARPSRFSKPRTAIAAGIAGIVLAGGAALWMLPGASASEPYFAPGLWLAKRELIEVTYPKLPEEAVEQLKQTVQNDPNPEECISEAVAREPDVNLFDPGNKGGCTLSSFQLGNGRMTGYLNCPRPAVERGVMSVVFRGTYSDRLIVMEQDVTLAEPAGELKFKARETTHWVAKECPIDNR